MKPHNKHAAANIKTGGYGEDTKLDLGPPVRLLLRAGVDPVLRDALHSA